MTEATETPTAADLGQSDLEGVVRQLRSDLELLGRSELLYRDKLRAERIKVAALVRGIKELGFNEDYQPVWDSWQKLVALADSYA